jgi:uncharacterized protein
VTGPLTENLFCGQDGPTVGAFGVLSILDARLLKLKELGVINNYSVEESTMKLVKLLIAFSILLSFSGNVRAASFDCAKASNLAEKAICSDHELSSLDDQVSAAYKAAMHGGAVDADKLRISQRTWIKSRNTCLDVPCLKDSINNRLAFLSSITNGSNEQPSGSASSSDSISSDAVSVFPTAVAGFADAASKAAEDADFAKSAASNDNYVTRILNSLSPRDRNTVNIIRNGHQAGNTESIGNALEKAFSAPLSWKVSQAGNVTIVEFDGSMIFGDLAQIDLSRSSNAQVHLAEIQMKACQNERSCKSLLTTIFKYCDAPERDFPDEASKGTCAQNQVDLIRLQPIPISVKFNFNPADSSSRYSSNSWNLPPSELSKLIY